MVWTGLLVGILFGIILQRGRICFNSAYRDVLLFKDNYLLKFYTFTVGLQAILLVVFAKLKVLVLNPAPFNPIGNTIGAYIFGLGMVLAGGCASGVTYRIGEGMTTSWLAGLSFGLTAAAVQGGVLSFLREGITKFNVFADHTSGIYMHSSGATLADVFKIDPLLMAIIFAAALWIYTFATKTTKRETKMDWRLAGVLLSALSVFAWWTSSHARRIYGLGITGGWVNIMNVLTTKAKVNWIGAEVLGIIIGAAISAVAGKEFKLRMPKNPITYVQVMIGGALMGLGAVLAGGCNIGHSLTGVPLMAISSIVSTIFFILGNWTMAWILFGRK